MRWREDRIQTHPRRSCDTCPDVEAAGEVVPAAAPRPRSGAALPLRGRHAAGGPRARDLRGTRRRCWPPGRANAGVEGRRSWVQRA